MRKKIILDTSLFVNPASAQVFGRTPTSALISFLELAERAAGTEFLMPPSIYAELMHFAEEHKVPKKLLLLIHKKPPRKHEVKVPGIFLYELVESMRDRIDRGLRLAERHVREALQAPAPVAAGGAESRPVRADAESISRLRETYRRIMREGALDSRADVDLLLLAYETEGTLVSADLGVVEWAEKLGISLLSYEHFFEFLTEQVAKGD